jgi:hypothetical protein
MTPSGNIPKFVLRDEVVAGLLTFDEVRVRPEPVTADQSVIA